MVPEVTRILVVRPDRIGDVILSTPVFNAIRKHYKDAYLAVLVQETVLPIISGLPAVDEVIVLRPGVGYLRRLLGMLKERRFDAVIVLQGGFILATLLWLARIPLRIGPLSKPFSYFLYNAGLRQNRSSVEMHEADYNLQLLEKIGIRVKPGSLKTSVFVHEETIKQARVWLIAHGWSGKGPLIAMHPGMGGSALNWPESKYIQLAKELLGRGFELLITGGAGEHLLLERIRSEVSGPGLPKLVLYFGKGAYGSSDAYNGGGAGGIDFLAGLFSLADLVIAPSTGPLHLAVALDKPVLAFYPPVRVQSAKRWGPYPAGSDHRAVLESSIDCREVFSCKKASCESFPCMNLISVNDALQRIEMLIVLSKI
ncbi:MAG: glycosyltransferase family 9 protein [Bdellovibrionota bacterium]